MDLLAWVQRREEEDENNTVRLPPMVHRRPPERSIHDAQRENTPVTPSHPGQHASRWRNFVEGTAAYPPNTSHSEKAGTDWLAEQPDLNSPWLANHQGPENEGEGSGDDQRELFGKKKHRIWYKQIHVGSPADFFSAHALSILAVDHAVEQPNGSSDISLHRMDIFTPGTLACRQYLSYEQCLQCRAESIDRNGYRCRRYCSFVFDIHHL